MKRIIRLRNVCACALPGALEALAQEVQRRKGRNHRPCPELVVLRTEEDMVPLAINLPTCLASFGLYSERPGPHNPRGKRALGITAHVCASCPNLHPGGTGGDLAPGGKRCHDQWQDQCHERCHGCTHACWSELTVYIKQTREFPFPPEDVDWFLYHYFHMDDLAAAKIHEDYDFLYDVTTRFQIPAEGLAAGDVPNLLRGEAAPGAGAPDASGTSQPAVRRGPGAPQLDCNVWLYKKMWAAPDPRAYGHLAPGWLELYVRQMGVKPADWEKSFRMAARYCLARILRVRGELRSPGAGNPAGDQAGDQAGEQANDCQDGKREDPNGDEFGDDQAPNVPS